MNDPEVSSYLYLYETGYKDIIKAVLIKIRLF